MSYNNLTRPNRFYRGIAIFFLLFTALDLTSSWPCPEDEQKGFSIAQQSNSTAKSVNSFERPSSDQPNHQPGSDVEEHDCFCCCTHLTPVDVVRIADLSVHEAAIPRNIISLPIAPAQGTDHPPRLA